MPNAIQISRFGGPEVLELVDVPMPEIGDDQVRIRVMAAGVSPSETKLRAGALPDLPLPTSLGDDVAGTIEASGGDVSGFAVGDEVLGSAPMAAYAEYAAADPRDLAPKPADLPWEVAGSLSVAAKTAYRLLAQLHLVEGETLLIHGASGGVGAMATQLAKLRGANVLGTASVGNQDFLRSLGAEAVPRGLGLADRLRATAPAGVDAVLDASGHGELSVSVELAGGPGRVITIVASDADRFGVRFSSGDEEIDTSGALPEILEALDRGTIDLPVWRTYPLAEAAAAHAASEAGHPPGRIVLAVGMPIQRSEATADAE